MLQSTKIVAIINFLLTISLFFKKRFGDNMVYFPAIKTIVVAILIPYYPCTARILAKTTFIIALHNGCAIPYILYFIFAPSHKI